MIHYVDPLSKLRVQRGNDNIVSAYLFHPKGLQIRGHPRNQTSHHVHGLNPPPTDNVGLMRVYLFPHGWARDGEGQGRVPQGGGPTNWLQGKHALSSMMAVAVAVVAMFLMHVPAQEQSQNGLTHTATSPVVRGLLLVLVRVGVATIRPRLELQHTLSHVHLN